MTFQLSPLVYPGGKSRAVQILKQYVPLGVEEMVSPFIGGGSFEIHMANCGVRVYGYDAFHHLVNFWKYLLDKPQELANEVMTHHPASGDDYRRMKAYLCDEGWYDDPFQAAVYFFIVNRMSFSGLTLTDTGTPKDHNFSKPSVAFLSSFRCPNLSVEYADYRDILRRNRDKFMYLDPPYMIKRNLYGVDGELHAAFNHNELALMLQQCKTQFLLSYNNCDEIKRLYTGFYIYHHKWANGIAARSSSSRDNDELLICNYPLPSMPLFE